MPVILPKVNDMTTITKENLIQMLQDDPALLEEMRSLLLTRELVELPQKFAEFAASVDKQFEAIDGQFEAINQRFEAIDRQFEAINQRFEAIDRQFEAINQRFEAIDRQFEAINQRFEAIDRQFEVVNKRLDNLESDVGQLKVDVGYLKGKSLESELPGRAAARIVDRFDIRRHRVVRASTQYTPTHDFDDAVFDAFKAGILSGPQRRRIFDTDMIVRGRSLETNNLIYVAVESSFTIDDSDIVRAKRTETALKKMFPGAEVRAAVYCSAISDENSQRAEDDGVLVISNARI